MIFFFKRICLLCPETLIMSDLQGNIELLGKLAETSD